MPQLMQDEAGQYFVDTGGGVLQPVSEDQARTFLGGQGVLAGAGQAAEQGLQNLYTGVGSLLGDDPNWQAENQRGREQSAALNLANPVTSGAAQFAPQVAVGLATGSAGFWPTVGVEAALGAATTPESPVEGAIVGGATGALPFAVGPAARAAGRGAAALRERLPFGAGALPQQGMPGVRVLDEAAPSPPAGAAPSTTPPYLGPTNLADDMNAAPGTALAAPARPSDAVADLPPAPRMAERVQARLEGEDMRLPDTPGPRVLQGTLLPDQLEGQYRIPTSPAQKAILTARSPGEYQRALEGLNAEEAALSSPLFGRQGNQIRYMQKEGATNFLANELEIPAGLHITDHALHGVFTRVGDEMDRIAQEMGEIPFGSQLQAELSNVMGQVTGGHQRALQAIVDEIGRRAELRGGMVTGEDWGFIRSKLDAMQQAAKGQGKADKLFDAGNVQEVMVNALEARLPAETARRLERLRKQYAIASTLTKPGTRDADGLLNPTSFYNHWKRPQSKRFKGQDDVGEFMNTMVTLTKKRTPDSGTAGRLLQNAASMGLDLVPGGGLVRGLIR